MTSDPSLELVARLGGVLNAVHGFIYFAPEATAAYDALGLEAGQHYFASRAAPLGPASAEIVSATFFNFNPEFVATAIPAAWSAADPDVIQTARMRAAAEVIERCCPDLDDSDVEEASEIARAMLLGIGYEGKPLAAANRAVPEPSDALTRLWQRVTVLREWRGDVHVAVLVAAPVTAVQALILHAATDKVPKAALVATRRWPDEAWSGGVASLIARGLVDADEQFTDAGRTFRDNIEERTNHACQPMIDAVGEAAAGRLYDLLRPIRRALVDGGAFAGFAT